MKIYFLLLTILLSTSFKTEDSNESIKIEAFTFSEVPKKIVGCSCYFAKDSIAFKKQQFIYLNDYAKISFMKLNGEVIEFSMSDFHSDEGKRTISKYPSKNYNLEIQVKSGPQNGDETWIKTGSIQVSDKKGNKAIINFFGECGC
jgi:hypothetical protein